MDLSAFPTRAVLRWNLAVRLLLSVVIPIGVSLLAVGQLTQVTLVVTLAAALVSFANLGPDLSARPWVLTAALGVPAAVVLGALSIRLSGSGVALVFVLFTVHGAMVRAGVLAQLAWFPVGTAGMLASLLLTDSLGVGTVAVAAVAGSALALLLVVVVPWLVRAPRLGIPAEALAVDTSRLRRMVRTPQWRDWMFPLLLGTLSAGLLVATSIVTGGFKPYWAVLAFVSVLQPSVAETRTSAVQTVTASLVGVLLSAVVIGSGLAPGWQVLTITGLGVVGAALLLRNGTLAHVLLTPLPVVMAVIALGEDGVVALPARFVEYLVGAAVGLGVVLLAETLERRLWSERAEPDAEAPTGTETDDAPR